MNYLTWMKTDMLTVKKKIASAAKWVWQKANGKKTISGAVCVVMGCLAAEVPFFQPISQPLIYAGLDLFGIGIIHKGAKYVSDKKQQ